jgi:hypothetical protein
MARKAAGEDDGPSNVISLARARTAVEARRAMFRWPLDGPHPERVAAAALDAAAGEGALVADGTILAVNRRWVLATTPATPPSSSPACGPPSAAPTAGATTSQIPHRRTDQASMDTQEGHRHE